MGAIITPLTLCVFFICVQIKLWDVRVTKPVQDYKGHYNEHAYLPIHINEPEGLLLAGMRWQNVLVLTVLLLNWLSQREPKFTSTMLWHIYCKSISRYFISEIEPAKDVSCLPSLSPKVLSNSEWTNKTLIYLFTQWVRIATQGYGAWRTATFWGPSHHPTQPQTTWFPASSSPPIWADAKGFPACSWLSNTTCTTSHTTQTTRMEESCRLDVRKKTESACFHKQFVTSLPNVPMMLHSFKYCMILKGLVG